MCYQCRTIDTSAACGDPYFGADKGNDIGECDAGFHCLKYKTVAKIRDSGYIMGWERCTYVR